MTRDEEDRLVMRATELGVFLFADEPAAWAAARAGALASVWLLPDLVEHQRRRIRHNAHEPRRRLILSSDQLVQARTYAFADKPGNPSYRSRCVEYLKTVAYHCLLGSSFEACVLVNRFIYPTVALKKPLGVRNPFQDGGFLHSERFSWISPAVRSDLVAI